MDAFKNLPLAARIGIPAVLVLVVAFLAYSTMLKPEPPVELISTTNYDNYKSSKRVLANNSITFHEESDGEVYSISVSPGDRSKAAQVLAENGVRDTTSVVKKVSCGAAPGFTATRSATEEAMKCGLEKKVQTMLLATGAVTANVTVSLTENGTLLGPEKSVNVVAHLTLPESLEESWSAESAATAIAGTAGTTLDRVFIGDMDGKTLYNGSKSASATSGSEGTNGLGCTDIAGATEVETKRAAVRNCYRQTIGDELTDLLGSSTGRWVLTVEPTIDSVARHTTQVRNSPGTVKDRSAQSGSGQKVEDTSNAPNTTETTSTDPAGDIRSLKISVILNKDVVTEEQRVAVMTLLSSHVDTKRGDPAPVVKMSKISGGTADKPSKEDVAAIKDNATAGADTQKQQVGPGVVTPKPSVPPWMLAIVAVLVVGILTAILVLWRKSAAMAAERARLEASFKNEQRLFEDFAQQNPDHLAQDLNALFGAPSAPEPVMRR